MVAFAACALSIVGVLANNTFNTVTFIIVLILLLGVVVFGIVAVVIGSRDAKEDADTALPQLGVADMDASEDDKLGGVDFNRAAEHVPAIIAPLMGDDGELPDMGLPDTGDAPAAPTRPSFRKEPLPAQPQRPSFSKGPAQPQGAPYAGRPAAGPAPAFGTPAAPAAPQDDDLFAPQDNLFGPAPEARQPFYDAAPATDQRPAGTGPFAPADGPDAIDVSDFQPVPTAPRPAEPAARPAAPQRPVRTRPAMAAAPQAPARPAAPAPSDSDNPFGDMLGMLDDLSQSVSGGDGAGFAMPDGR